MSQPEPRPSDDEIERALVLVTDTFSVQDAEAQWALDVLRRASAFPQLMGAKEARIELGVGASGNFTPEKVPGLPKPRQKLAATAVWGADDIRAYGARRAKERTDGDKQG